MLRQLNHVVNVLMLQGGLKAVVWTDVLQAIVMYTVYEHY